MTDPDNQAQVDAILMAALEISSETERSEYLSQACGDDSQLRREVEELIEADQSAGAFLQQAAAQQHAELLSTVYDEESVDETVDAVLHMLSPSQNAAHLGCIDDYEVVGILGQGGMGLVLEGVDVHLQRPVASRSWHRSTLEIPPRGNASCERAGLPLRWFTKMSSRFTR